MQVFSTLLALYAGNSLVTGEFPAQTPVTRSFDVFFDLRLNKRLSKQSWGWWSQTPLRSLWRHCNVADYSKITTIGNWVIGELIFLSFTAALRHAHGGAYCWNRGDCLVIPLPSIPVSLRRTGELSQRRTQLRIRGAFQRQMRRWDAQHCLSQRHGEGSPS